MDNKNLTYRLANCCEDNAEYLRCLYDKYLECYNEFLANYPKGSSNEFEDFKTYVACKDIEILAGVSTEANTEFWKEMAIVNSFVRFGYISIPDFKWEYNGYNLGTDIKDVDLIKNVIAKNKNLKEGIITADGTFYTARGGHYTLSCWLMLNGIDVSKGVRTTSCLESTRFMFSDLTDYCNMNHNLEITEEQARAMFNIYRLNSAQIDSSFQTIILESCGQGQQRFLKGENNGLFRKNLETIETEVEKLNSNKDNYKEYQKNYFSANILEKELEDFSPLTRFIQKYGSNF